MPPLITVFGIGLLGVGFVLTIPILWTVGLVVLVVGLVLMAKERRGSATPKAAGAIGVTNPALDIPQTSETAQPAGSKGLSSQRKVWLVSALVLVVLAGVAINRIGIPFWQHSIYPRFFEKGSSAPASGSPGSQQSQSPYYQEGYDSGTSGLARKGYGDDMYNTGATVAEMEHNACSRAINNESNLASIQDADHPANQDDYMRGCLDAFRDHPPTGKPKPGPLNPYR
ncbi:hypothetical protein [Mycobacterium sp. E3198]|uniref:hypothetical protein n=1 Tax=Mycobacterium sp. E3198 TaxID=1834143 RepID=UPI0007FC679C|nr:hypothetical protein [Mycobacterium sp. E3198]OBG35798.1 hypothetical protein A5673_19580 [Mycobacterium sp. E3198]